MYAKFKYDQITNKKFKPIIKFNSGRGAILCNKCKNIIKEKLTWAEFRGHSNLLFCPKCALEMVISLFKDIK
jgi:uncharacterized CHY-type Zn-finger protein